MIGDVMLLALRQDILDQLGVEDLYSYTDLLAAAKIIKESGLAPSGFETFWCGDPAKCYDMLATVANQALWSFGGEIWDVQTYKVR